MNPALSSTVKALVCRLALLDPNKDVRGNVVEGVGDVQALIDRFNAVSDKFADPDLSEDAMNKLLEEQAKLQDAIDAKGGWELERKLEAATRRIEELEAQLAAKG